MGAPVQPCQRFTIEVSLPQGTGGCATRRSRLACFLHVAAGAGSITAAPDGTLWVCDSGNPAMATAGMGDVLTGVIAAFLAQGMTTAMAAVCAVQAHAMAGDLAAAGDTRGLLAGDVVSSLRQVVNP